MCEIHKRQRRCSWPIVISSVFVHSSVVSVRPHHVALHFVGLPFLGALLFYKPFLRKIHFWSTLTIRRGVRSDSVWFDSCHQTASQACGLSIVYERSAKKVDRNLFLRDRLLLHQVKQNLLNGNTWFVWRQQQQFAYLEMTKQINLSQEKQRWSAKTDENFSYKQVWVYSYFRFWNRSKTKCGVLCVLCVCCHLCSKSLYRHGVSLKTTEKVLQLQLCSRLAVLGRRRGGG